jgi:hypothetical protein
LPPSQAGRNHPPGLNESNPSIQYPAYSDWMINRPLKELSTFFKISLDCNFNFVVPVYPFNENLLKHINHELAEDAGPENVRGAS